MGLAGQIGLGAAQGLDDIIVQQLAKKKYEEDVRSAQAAEQIQRDRWQGEVANDQAALAQRATEHEGRMSLGQQEVDQRDRSRRDDANRAGVEDMLKQRETMDFEAAMADPSLPPMVKKIAGLSKAGVRGVSADDFVSPEDKRKAKLEDYEAQAKIASKYRDPGETLAEYEAKQQIRAKYDTNKDRTTAGEAQRDARVQGASSFLDRLDSLREKINTKMGPEQRLGGLVRRGVAAAGLDPDVAQYERERAAAGRALAVAIMGAQNLSDADAQAWANLLPDATVDKETATRLLGTVRETLNKMGGKGGAAIPAAADGELDYVPGKGLVPKKK